MLFIFPRRKINVFSLKLFPLKVGESYTYKRENLLFQLTSETPLLLSSKKRATRLLFAFSLPLSFSPLHSVVTISKWNNEKKGRCEMGGDVSSSARLRAYTEMCPGIDIRRVGSCRRDEMEARWRDRDRDGAKKKQVSIDIASPARSTPKPHR